MILSILKNEKYMGDALLQKTFIKDIYNHKSKRNEGELKQYYIVNSHDAIVSKDVYNEVQLRLKDRGLAFSTIDTYSSLLKCSLYGNIYHIRYYINHHYKTPIKQWICSNKYSKENAARK